GADRDLPRGRGDPRCSGVRQRAAGRSELHSRSIPASVGDYGGGHGPTGRAGAARPAAGLLRRLPRPGARGAGGRGAAGGPTARAAGGDVRGDRGGRGAGPWARRSTRPRAGRGRQRGGSAVTDRTQGGEAPVKLSSVPVHNGRIVHLSIDTVRFPDGKVGEMEMIRHSGAAAVLPLLSERDDPGAEIALIPPYR